MIKTAVIVSEDSPEDEVGMNNTVDIYFEEDDVTETYKLVTTVRSNSLKNLISRESPLGAAIFGHKAGDRCEVHVMIIIPILYRLSVLSILWMTAQMSFENFNNRRQK